MSYRLRSRGHAPDEPAGETSSSSPASTASAPATQEADNEATEDPVSPSRQAASRRRRQLTRLLTQTTQELPLRPTASPGLKPSSNSSSSSSSNDKAPTVTTSSQPRNSTADRPPNLAAYKVAHAHTPKLAVQAHAFATSLYVSGAGTKRGDGVPFEGNVGPPRHGPTALHPVGGFDSSPASREMESQIDEFAMDAAARGDRLALFLATAQPKSVGNSNGMSYPRPGVVGDEDPEQSPVTKSRRIMGEENGSRKAKSSATAAALGGRNDRMKAEKNERKKRGLRREEQETSGNRSSEETSGNMSTRSRTAYRASSELIVLDAPSTEESVEQNTRSSLATDVQQASSVTTPRRETLQDMYERLEQEGERDGMADVPALTTRSSRKRRRS